jgi:hypothetical protein
MSYRETIPELTKETFDNWAKQIIEKNSLTTKSILENIAQSVADFFDELFVGYEISFTDLHPNKLFPFSIGKKGGKPIYGDEQFYDEFYKVQNHIYWTFVRVLEIIYQDRECPYDTLECPY